jgi:hypothetical protein
MRSEVECGISRVVLRAQIHTVPQQQLHDVRVAAVRRQVQRPKTITIFSLQ